jgi:hypothetical protein
VEEIARALGMPENTVKTHEPCPLGVASGMVAKEAAMTCAELQRWLDDGRPVRERSRMSGHIAACAHCKRELRAADEVERLLAVIVPE